MKEGERLEFKMRKLEQKYQNLDLVGIAQSYGTSDQARAAQEGDTVSGERLCCGLSLFESMLKQIQNYLSEDSAWRGEVAPSNGVMYIDECTEFHKVWSACQWVICLPCGKNNKTVEELYGDGVHYSGLAIIYLLRQDNRFNALDFCYHFLRGKMIENLDEILYAF